jgi:branched-subunit amino acid transport protein
MRAAGWIVIGVVGVGTYLLRSSFLFVADRMAALPEHVRVPLGLIPPAVLAALVAPAVLRPEGAGVVMIGPRSLAAMLALGIALWTRSVLATIGVGLLAVAILERIMA